VKRGDRVVFQAPKSLGDYSKWEGLTGVVLARDVAMGKTSARYLVYWSNGKRNTEWEFYLKKIGDA
tara:strand:+ start:29 stop:226 length:198 start_codon:yes stop_codon:yes gene_type:complete